MKTNSLLLIGILVVSSCADFTPKPKAYPKIEYPAKTYTRYNAPCNYSFEVPTYSKVEAYNYEDKPCWFNIQFEDFNGTLHLSYLKPSGQEMLDSLAEDAYQMVFKPHLQRADEIVEREVRDTVKGFTGMIYDLEGKTATPFNFYLTDSKRHFVRGSFYFNAKTNSDSVQPIYDFLNQDFLHTITSFVFN